MKLTRLKLTRSLRLPIIAWIARRSALNKMTPIIVTLPLVACMVSGSGDSQTTQTRRTSSPSLKHLSDQHLQLAASMGTKHITDETVPVQHVTGSPSQSRASNQHDATAMLVHLLVVFGGDASGLTSDRLFARPHRPDSTLGPLLDRRDALLDITLGLEGQADVTRDADSVFVHPDTRLLCAYLIGDMQVSAGVRARAADQRRQRCLSMIDAVRVRIHAHSAESGNISYLLRGDPVFSICYSPGNASYKVYLNGLHLALERLRDEARLI